MRAFVASCGQTEEKTEVTPSNREAVKSVQTLRMLLAIALTALVVMFAMQNLATVEITFFTWSATLPRAFIYLIILGVGVLIGRLFKLTGGA